MTATNKIDAIRNRTLSKSEKEKIDFLAGNVKPSNAGASKTLDGIKDAKTATAAALSEKPVPPPATTGNKVEDLARTYYEKYEKEYGDNAACSLTIASMNLEAALLIIKAIKEYKWVEVKKP